MPQLRGNEPILGLNSPFVPDFISWKEGFDPPFILHHGDEVWLCITRMTHPHSPSCGQDTQSTSRNQNSSHVCFNQHPRSTLMIIMLLEQL
jgi:hypothetical protein